MKTNELTGAALDWAVAKCEHPNLVWGSSIGIHHASHQIVIPHLPEPQCYWNPSTNWAQGGPIIERERIGVLPSGNAYYERDGGIYFNYGPAPLISAMRCYVASKMGDEITLPKELT